MLRTYRRLSLSIFGGFVAMGILLSIYLARKMPLRYFVFSWILVAGLIAVDLTARRICARRIPEPARFKVLLELVLALVYFVAFYLFAAYIYPGMK